MAGINNYYFSSGRAEATTTFMFDRIDYALSDANQLFGRFNISRPLAFHTGLGPQDVAFVSTTGPTLR